MPLLGWRLGTGRAGTPLALEQLTQFGVPKEYLQSVEYAANLDAFKCVDASTGQIYWVTTSALANNSNWNTWLESIVESGILDDSMSDTDHG